MTRIELVDWLERTYQQLQERRAAQRRHTDQQWRRRTLHEVAHSHAERSYPWHTGSTAPEKKGLAQRWQMTSQRTLQRLTQLARTTVQQARETVRVVCRLALRSIAQAVRRRRLRQGLVPICAFCHHIRDERGTWQRLEAYMQAHFAVDFTHDFCPHCAQRHYGVTLADEAGGGEMHRGD